LHLLMGEVERFALPMSPESFSPTVTAIPTSRLHMAHMPSCAYLFSSPDGYLLYSGDIAEPVPVLRDATWLQAHTPLWVFHDIAFRRVPTHCYYEDLYPWVGQLEIWGYHCDPAQAPLNNRLPLVHHSFFLH
jgi:hypothetical protein